MKISKTKIKNRLQGKTNPSTMKVITLAKNQKAWLSFAKIVAGPTRNYVSINLEDLNEKVSAGDIAVIPGKILSLGNLEKKAKLCALSFSKSAIEKLKKAKIEFCLVDEEIKKNPDAKGVKIIQHREPLRELLLKQGKSGSRLCSRTKHAAQDINISVEGS